MDRLFSTIGYTFEDKTLLSAALTHSSYANENRGSRRDSYERLEFLGDSILGFLVAEHLYLTRETAEGELTRTRAQYVCEPHLAHVAGSIDLGSHLLLGKGEEAAGGRTRPSILADCVESLIAALYLEGGMEAARAFVRRFVLAGPPRGQAAEDYKTILQELVQRDGTSELNYRLVSESGPDHRKEFSVEALINGKLAGSGSGRSKKEAEQMAAKDALQAMKK